MDSTPKIRKIWLPKHSIVYWFITVIILVIVTIVTTMFYRHYFDRFDINHVTPNDNFEFSDEITCEVVYSTFKPIQEESFKFFEIPTFTLSRLSSENPVMDFDGRQYDLEKTKESNFTATYQVKLPEGFGEDIVEIIQVIKDTGTFVRTFMGQKQYFGGREALHPEMFQYVVSQKGRCE
ncbi:MAG: hypothetical protein WCW66_04325 [Patescibacteria group bacterium]